MIQIAFGPMDICLQAQDDNSHKSQHIVGLRTELTAYTSDITLPT